MRSIFCFVRFCSLVLMVTNLLFTQTIQFAAAYKLVAHSTLQMNRYCINCKCIKIYIIKYFFVCHSYVCVSVSVSFLSFCFNVDSESNETVVAFNCHRSCAFVVVAVLVCESQLDCYVLFHFIWLEMSLYEFIWSEYSGTYARH